MYTVREIYDDWREAKLTRVLYSFLMINHYIECFRFEDTKWEQERDEMV